MTSRRRYVKQTFKFPFIFFPQYHGKQMELDGSEASGRPFPFEGSQRCGTLSESRLLDPSSFSLQIHRQQAPLFAPIHSLASRPLQIRYIVILVLFVGADGCSRARHFISLLTRCRPFSSLALSLRLLRQTNSSSTTTPDPRYSCWWHISLPANLRPTDKLNWTLGGCCHS